MLPFRMTHAPRPRSASSPLHLCVLRELCVETSPSVYSHCYTSPKTSANSDQNRFFQISALRTLPSSVSCKSFACHSYENCRVHTNNSHSGTRHSTLITRHCIQVLSFHILAHSFALNKNSTVLFSSDSALFAQNTRVWGTPPLSLRGAKSNHRDKDGEVNSPLRGKFKERAGQAPPYKGGKGQPATSAACAT